MPTKLAPKNSLPAGNGNGHASNGNGYFSDDHAILVEALTVLSSARKGDRQPRMSRDRMGVPMQLAEVVNDMLDQRERMIDELARLGRALRAVKKGDFSVRLPEDAGGVARGVAEDFNEIIELNARMAGEFERISRVVGKQGQINQRASLGAVQGRWRDCVASVNSLITDLVQPTNEVARVIGAVAKGDLSQTMALEVDGRPVKGEFLRIAKIVNTMVAQLSSFASEVTRVAREVGTEGKLGGQAHVKGVAGTWKDLTDNVNSMAANLTAQVRNIAQVTTAVAKGDLSKKITVDVKGEILALKDTINTMVDQLNSFASEVTRVAREVGTEGKLGGQAQVKGVGGTWKDLTDNVNSMAANLTTQVRNIADVTTAVARGDLSKKITVDVKGEILELKNTINTMVDQLNSFASEVTRVAREVGSEGKLGGQAEVKGVGGTWKDLTENVNSMAANLTNQVRNIAEVTTAVAKGDLSKKITVDVRGEILELKNTINTMVDQLGSFASEVTRVAREVGTEGKLGGQAHVKGVAGTWKDLTDNVNSMAANLTAQVRNIADVTTAVARGDLSKKITVDVRGEILELKNTINTMVDQLNSFASEVTRVAREVGTEGKLGGQAQVKGVAGTWKDLTDNVNSMAFNLTSQVRGIASVVTAVANGDLDRKLMLEVKGEIAALADTINGMTDTLALFADQVTTVAREVGVEGKLGGQAKVPSASGTWRNLTDNVNQLAANLTTQVRAIAEVATAVTKGDLTRSISVEAQGEVAALKDNINEMIRNLKDTTQKNTEQDWLKTNLARFSRMLQGQRDLGTVSQLILSELAPLVNIQYGAFYIVEPGQTLTPQLRRLGGYAYRESPSMPERFKSGEGLVGQCAAEKKRILLTDLPKDYIRVSSSLGEAAPTNVVILPVFFEGEVNGVIELASFERFSGTHLAFLDQLTVSIGLMLNTIAVNMRTENLLKQSQSLAQSLQSQQIELKETNEQLEEKARLLSEQNEEIERKNQEVELAKKALEEKADQLALTSKYKSQFLANMSHELRTPLNSLLILAKMLYQNSEGNLTPRQIDFAKTVYSSGSDLLALINEILDMSKIESGMITVEIGELDLAELSDYVDRNFRQVAQDRGLEFNLELAAGMPKTMLTDAKRLQQVLKNLLSNAFKFTEKGSVSLRVGRPEEGAVFESPVLQEAEDVIAFSVEDTGIGIPVEKRKIIFEAFQQADMTTSRKYGGTGLGLTISREIAKLLGGEIHVEGAAGGGSRFTLYLPSHYVPVKAAVVAPAAEAEAAAAAPPQRPAPATPLPQEVEVVQEVRDDRDAVSPGDRVLLIVEDDVPFARILLERARGSGLKGVVAQRGEAALALARKYKPDAITLDIRLPDMDGWRILDLLKHDAATRHIPVHIISVDVEPQRGARVGALDSMAKPATAEGVDEAIKKLKDFIDRRVKGLLIVEDDDVQRRGIVELIASEDIQTTAVGTGAEALEALAEKKYDCMILDLGLSDMSGFELLERMGADESLRRLPVIIYTGRDLNQKEKVRLKKLAKSVIIKDAGSPELLLDEASLYLHRQESTLPEDKRRMIERLRLEDPSLAGKKVLVVDDDVRNIFALTSLLEQHGIKVAYAENGKSAIQMLESTAGIDLVLMDVMMPDMDGYDTMRAIRRLPKFRSLPIVALTAKAMKGDREKCLEAGASDYIAKPVDIPQLLSMLRVWMYR